MFQSNNYQDLFGRKKKTNMDLPDFDGLIYL